MTKRPLLFRFALSTILCGSFFVACHPKNNRQVSVTKSSCGLPQAVQKAQKSQNGEVTITLMDDKSLDSCSVSSLSTKLIDDLKTKLQKADQALVEAQESDDKMKIQSAQNHYDQVKKNFTIATEKLIARAQEKLKKVEGELTTTKLQLGKAQKTQSPKKIQYAKTKNDIAENNVKSLQTIIGGMQQSLIEVHKPLQKLKAKPTSNNNELKSDMIGTKYVVTVSTEDVKKDIITTNSEEEETTNSEEEETTNSEEEETLSFSLTIKADIKTSDTELLSKVKIPVTIKTKDPFIQLSTGQLDGDEIIYRTDSKCLIKDDDTCGQIILVVNIIKKLPDEQVAAITQVGFTYQVTEKTIEDSSNKTLSLDMIEDITKFVDVGEKNNLPDAQVLIEDLETQLSEVKQETSQNDD